MSTRQRIRTRGRGIAALVVVVAVGGASAGTVEHDPLSEPVLAARVGVFAHDSLGGRAFGTTHHDATTSIIARVLGDAGAGSDGSVQDPFQSVEALASTPLIERAVLAEHRVPPRAGRQEWGARAYRAGVDFVPVRWRVPGVAQRVRIASAPIVFGGVLGDSLALTPERTRGMIALFHPPRDATGARAFDWRAWASLVARHREAAAVLIASLDVTPRAMIGDALAPRFVARGAAASRDTMPPTMLVSLAVAQQMLQLRDQDGPPRTARVSYDWTVERVPRGNRNVIARIEGSDPALRGEHVLIVAHTDHLGTGRSPAGIDSVFNGASDNASGVVAMLALAEAVRASGAPRRSLLFAWTAGGEHGGLGAEWLLAHAPVPRAQIVAGVHIDGLARAVRPRGSPAADSGLVIATTGNGGEHVAGAIASASRSTGVDIRFIAPGDAPHGCAGDFAALARAGLPAVSVSSGWHPAFHLPDDDMRALDTRAFARAVSFLVALVREVANAPATGGQDHAGPPVCS